MNKDKWNPEESYLLHNILQDDDVQTVKQNINDKRHFAFSAPPALYDISFKEIDKGVIDEWDFQEPELEQKVIPNTMLKIQSQKQSDYFSPQLLPQKPNSPSQNTNHFTNFTLYPINEVNYFQLNNLTNENLIPNLNDVSQWARDQNGSRTVQKILENGSDENKDEIFNALFKQSKDLMQDRFGNYVFQKFFESGLPSHKKLLLESLKGQIVQLSQNSFGCRVIQKAIESIANDQKQQDIFIKQIQPSALHLIENQNGNHVIQKCFQIIIKPKMNVIVQIIIQKLQSLAFHAYGCRVIQKYLQNAQKGQRSKLVLNKLLDMGFELSHCQFGNYVMQYIVSNCHEQSQKIQKIFFQNFFNLSCNKYASNVIQKGIKSSRQSFRDKLAQWLCGNGLKQLVLLAKNQFGNYVIQSLYQRINKELKNKLKGKLKQSAQQITKSQYGRHVMMQLDKNR